MFQPVQGLFHAKPPTHLVLFDELTKKVVSGRHILGMPGARVLTHSSEGRTLTHIPVPETNTRLKQGAAWPKEETAGNDYLGLRCSFLDMCSKILPGSILFSSFDDTQLT